MTNSTTYLNDFFIRSYNMSEEYLIEEFTQEDLNELVNMAKLNQTKFQKMAKLYKTLLTAFKTLSEYYINDRIVLKLNGIEDSNETLPILELIRTIDSKIDLKSFEKQLQLEFPKKIIKQINLNQSNNFNFSLMQRNNEFRIIPYTENNKLNIFRELDYDEEEEIYSGLYDSYKLKRTLNELYEKKIINYISIIKFEGIESDKVLKEFKKIYNS